MVASLVLALVAGAPFPHPDLVLVLGVPHARDQDAIRRDCDTWRQFWLAEGVSPSSIIFGADLHTKAELVAKFAETTRRMRTRNDGRLWICLSGHGTVVNHAPAIMLESRGVRKYTPVPWGKLLDAFSASGWHSFLIADLCHNNMLANRLPNRMAAILWDEDPTNEQCRVQSFAYPEGGSTRNRGVISWLAVRSFSGATTLEEVAQRMSAFSRRDHAKYGAPQYGFIVAQSSP